MPGIQDVNKQLELYLKHHKSTQTYETLLSNQEVEDIKHNLEKALSTSTQKRILTDEELMHYIHKYHRSHVKE
jgi:hypothetical protein